MSPTSEGSRPPSAATNTEPKKKDKALKPPPSAADRQRKLVDEAKAKRAAEAKAEADQLAKIQRDLKGKEYMYDRDGSVIVMEETDVTKLPAHSVAPSVSVKSAGHGDFVEEMQQLKKIMGSVRTAHTSSDAEKSRAAAAARILEQQPSLIESMDVTEGVTLVEGAKTKAGPQRKAEANHMSLKDFQNYGGGASKSSGVTASMPTSSEPAPPPPPEPEPEPEIAMETGGSQLDGTVPLKDVPHGAKATVRQREEQMGQRLRFPRDRPFVNPTLPTRPIMPDQASNLASNQDTSPVGHRPGRLPPVDAKTILPPAATGASMTKASGVNRVSQVDERLARQLLQPER